MSKNLTASMKTSHIEEFKNVMNNGTTRNELLYGFVKTFEAESRLDIYSLLLNVAITASDVEVVKNIIQSCSNNLEILTMNDKFGHSPIYAALLGNNKIVLDLVSEFVASTKSFKHVDLNEQSYEEFSEILDSPPLYMDPNECFDKYLKPLYTESSLNNFDTFLENEINELPFSFTASSSGLTENHTTNTDDDYSVYFSGDTSYDARQASPF